MFNPKTEKFEKMIPDGSGQRGQEFRQVAAVAGDRFEGQRLRRLDHGRRAQQVGAGDRKVIGLSDSHTARHRLRRGGGRNDNIWIAEWGGGKIAKFDTRTNDVDRIHAADLAGPHAAPERGLREQHLVGHLGAGQPAGQAGEAGPDDRPDHGVHDSARDGAAVRRGAGYRGQHLVRRFTDAGSRRGDRQVQPKDQTFTFYPKPQFAADTPKIQVTRDGAVWCSPRGSPGRRAAISVLYPDMDKITTLGAYYVNGPPGYPFKTTAS